MARMTVNQIMTQIAATVNQEAISPTEGNAEWSLWLEYMNRAYQEWSQATDWESLRKVYFPAITGVSQASVAMPLDFKKLAAPVRLGIQGVEFKQELAEEQNEDTGMHSVHDNYFTILGDFSSGINLVFNPPTLSSGASIEVQYFSMVTTLASNTQIPLIQDPQFLIDRAVGYILEARSDARFQQQEVKARERLVQMVDNENDSKHTSYAGQNYLTTPEARTGFRIGRD